MPKEGSQYAEHALDRKPKKALAVSNELGNGAESDDWDNVEDGLSGLTLFPLKGLAGGSAGGAKVPISDNFKLELKNKISNARKTASPISESNYLSGHVQSNPSPDFPENGGLFYHEIQRSDSGTCSIHAANAYRGSGRYKPGDFTDVYDIYCGMAREEAISHMLKDGNDAGVVNVALEMLEPNLNLMEADKTKEQLADILERIDPEIDRVMVGLIGSGEIGHWVAFRKGGNGKWYKIDSYPGNIEPDNPQPNISPAEFMRGLRGTGSSYAIIYPSGSAGP